MYTPIDPSVTITHDDQVFLDTIKDDETKQLFSSLVLSVIDTNGSAESITPGIGKQYIESSQFFHKVDYEVMIDKFRIPIHLSQTFERALNWRACGKGKGGIAAAAIREAYRDKVDLKRETHLIAEDLSKHVALLKEFVAELEVNKLIYAFWKANADNVLAIAAAVMLKEGHHWDIQNQRPQRALLAALDQRDVFSDADMRKIFYLAVHPLPLKALMKYISEDVAFAKLNEAVRCRLRAPPAGTAGFVIASIGAQNLVNEEFFKFASDGFQNDIKNIIGLATDILRDPLPYHAMAPLFTDKDRKIIPVFSSDCLSLCIAYIKTCIKGSLANAPSLNKLSDQNARLVQKYSAALDRYVETRGADIAEMVSAGKSSYRKIERMERNEEIIADAKVRAEVQKAAVGVTPLIHGDD